MNGPALLCAYDDIQNYSLCLRNWSRLLSEFCGVTSEAFIAGLWSLLPQHIRACLRVLSLFTCPAMPSQPRWTGAKRALACRDCECTISPEVSYNVWGSRGRDCEDYGFVTAWRHVICCTDTLTTRLHDVAFQDVVNCRLDVLHIRRVIICFTQPKYVVALDLL